MKTKRADITRGVREASRAASLPKGPGLYNPTRSVRFVDRKKQENKTMARGRASSEM